MIAVRPHGARWIAVAAACWLALIACGGAVEEPVDEHELLANDPRLAHLLAPCSRTGPYMVDTSDHVAILIANLERGQLDALKRAKAELAECGEPCLREVQRSLERHWNSPDGSSFVRNALDVAQLAEGETARALIVRGLGHPVAGVRSTALRALTAHGRAEDFDAVLALLEGSGEGLWRTGLPLLHQLDPARAEALYLDWIGRGYLTTGWEHVALQLAASTQPATIAFARERLDDLPEGLRPFLAVVAARAGDERALAVVRDALTDAERATLRGAAVGAVRAAGLVDELSWTLRADPEPSYRVLAAETIGGADETDERRGWLVAATNDPDAGVRATCLEQRLRRGDAAAQDLALEVLESGPVTSLDDGVRLLRAGWDVAPELAERALDVLIARCEAEAHRPLVERAGLFAAIGAIPRRRAAQYLLELGRREGGGLQGLPAHRWLALRAANAGVEAWLFLGEELAEETDPLRRLDLIEALASGARVSGPALLKLLEDETTSPYEVLFVADRLAHIGPTRDVLPAMKRAALRTESYAIRTAMNCLLWTWYPEPRE